MSTTIEWTQRPGTKGETWNPTTGCNKVSAGCKNCYAEIMHRRLAAMGQRKYDRAFASGVVTHADTLTIPLGWKKPRAVFVNSMSDLFHADVPFAFIDQVFAIMALTPQHTYQILTKRPERMAEYFNNRSDGLAPDSEGMVLDEAYRMGLVVWDERGDVGHLYTHPVPSKEKLAKRRPPPSWPLPNLWLGTSVENQASADERIPHLLRVPAAVRFLSCEPLLGPIDLLPYLWSTTRDPATDEYESHLLRQLHWVITGGESGQHARPMHPAWPRFLLDQCKDAQVPFFFKQWGAWMRMEEDELYPAIKETILLTPAGSYFEEPALFDPKFKNIPGAEYMIKLGKHASGNLLDGRMHLEFPSTESRPSTYTAQGAEALTPQ